MAAITIHQHGISLATVPKPLTPSSSSLNPTALSIPSRFPPSAQSQVTISPRGGFFLWCNASPIIWEYDSRGKRIGEVDVSAGPSRAVGIGRVLVRRPEEGPDALLVSVHGDMTGDIRELRQENGKWRCASTLQGPRGEISALVTNSESSLVIAASAEEVILFDQIKGTRRTLTESSELYDVSFSGTVFAPSLACTLVIPSFSTPKLHLMDVSSTPASIWVVEPFSSGSTESISDIAFSPVVDSPEGKKGGLCAVLRAGSGKVALVGLDNPNSTAKIIDFGVGLQGIHFLNGALLAGRTPTGLLVRDLRSLSKEPVELRADEPILSIHLLPTCKATSKLRSARQSSAMSDTASVRGMSVLGEARNTGNIECVLPDRSLNENGKTKEMYKQQQRKASITRVDKPRARIASAPMAGRAERTEQSISGASSSRSASTSATTRRSSIGPSRLAAVAPLIEEEEEREEGEEGEEERLAAHAQVFTMEADGLNLSWALRPPTAAATAADRAKSPGPAIGGDDHRGEVSWEAMDEMRREVGNLQLDLLRMGRNLKHEIRMAVQPLVKELEEREVTIQRQRREIERLRRGY